MPLTAPAAADRRYICPADSLVADLKALGHASVHVYSLNAASTVQLLDAAGYKPLAHRCGR